MIEPYDDKAIKELRSLKYPSAGMNPDIMIDRLLLTIKQKDDEYKLLTTLYKMEREKKDKPIKLG